MGRRSYDAVVVGSGPNGLAAAITLARAGRSVLVAEARDTPGGGLRSAELTLPGFVHDVCAAIHPFGLASPFFRSLPLERHGLQWVTPPAPVAHPLDDGPAIIVDRSPAAAAEGLGRDGGAYLRLVAPLVSAAGGLMEELLAPLHLPRRPLLLARFGALALQPAAALARRTFREPRARALFAGMAGHAMLPLEQAGSSAFGLVMAILAHTTGWPLARGGSGRIADALLSYLGSLHGEVRTGWEVGSVDELPPARAYLLDVTPRQLLRIAGHRLPGAYRRRLERFRYGPGVCKVDLALDGPIPWKDEACRRAATVHLGGTLEEIAASERAAWEGRHAERPFVLLAQPTLFDTARAPRGKHTVWAYCHVPHGSADDVAPRIEAQIDRFAPGFSRRILSRRVHTAVELERYNPNYVGGDINGGVQDLRQLFTRPTVSLVPYATPARDLYLCSSSTPPGGGVHGMCGVHAARAALRRSL